MPQTPAGGNNKVGSQQILKYCFTAFISAISALSGAVVYMENQVEQGYKEKIATLQEQLKEERKEKLALEKSSKSSVTEFIELYCAKSICEKMYKEAERVAAEKDEQIILVKQEKLELEARLQKSESELFHLRLASESKAKSNVKGIPVVTDPSDSSAERGQGAQSM